MQQVAVADHHAPRRVGRPGGVLQKREGARVCAGVAPLWPIPRVEGVGRHTRVCVVAARPPAEEAREARRGLGFGRGRPRPPLGRPRRGQHDLGLRVLRDRDGPPEVPVGGPPPRREHRYRHDPRVQATEERRDEVEARGIHQQGPGARRRAGLQRRGDRPAPAVEFGVARRVALVLAVAEEDERPIVRLHPGPEPQQLDQRAAVEGGPPRRSRRNGHHITSGVHEAVAAAPAPLPRSGHHITPNAVH